MLIKSQLVLILLFLLFAINCTAQELVLERSYYIEGKEAIEPSGLIIKNGEFYFISDNNDTRIFKLIFDGDKCYAKPAIKLVFPKKTYAGKLNYEGITSDQNGNFYLVSEKEFEVIKSDANGNSEIFPSFYEESYKLGYFRKSGNGAEGIAVLGENRIFISSQEDLKGILEIRSTGKNQIINEISIQSPTINGIPQKERNISDLCIYNNEFYLLLKKQNIILKLTLNGNTLTENSFYSFNNAIADDYYFYKRGNNYGEGLAVDDKYFYIIYDNNGEGRLIDPKDRRALFLVIKK